MPAAHLLVLKSAPPHVVVVGSPQPAHHCLPAAAPAPRSLIVLKSGPSTWQRLGAYALLSIGGLMTLTAIYDHLTGQSLE